MKTAVGNNYYTTLDIKDAYYQVELSEQSRDLTTFSDGVSLYRFKRLSFGLSCSPAIFSRIMGNMLTPLVKQGWVKNYLDDIIIWVASFSSLLKWLDTLFKHLSNHGAKLNAAKCHFSQPEVRFLGHLMSKDGCRSCPKNVSAVVDMNSPSNIKEVQRFLGMCGFYCKHIKDYAKIAVPLTNLLRQREPFMWTPECQKGFGELKSSLTSALVLIKPSMTTPVYNFLKTFDIWTVRIALKI